MQAAICVLLIPLSVIKEDYWQNRLEYFNIQTKGDLKNKELYTSAPLISGFYGYTSFDICEVNTNEFKIPVNSAFILDKFGLSKCEDKLRQIYNLLLAHTSESINSYIYKTSNVVELERFSARGEESVLIVVTSNL